MRHLANQNFRRPPARALAWTVAGMLAWGASAVPAAEPAGQQGAIDGNAVIAGYARAADFAKVFVSVQKARQRCIDSQVAGYDSSGCAKVDEAWNRLFKERLYSSMYMAKGDRLDPFTTNLAGSGRVGNMLSATAPDSLLTVLGKGEWSRETLHADLLKKYGKNRDVTEMEPIIRAAVDDYYANRLGDPYRPFVAADKKTLIAAMLRADRDSDHFLTDLLVENARDGGSALTWSVMDFQDALDQAEAEDAAQKARKERQRRAARDNAGPGQLIPIPPEDPPPPPPRQPKDTADKDTWDRLAAAGRQDQADKDRQTAALQQSRLSLTLGRATVAPGERMSITARVEAPPDAPLGDRVQFSVSRGRLDQTSVGLTRGGVALAIYTPPDGYSGTVTVTARVAGLPAVTRRFTVDAGDRTASADPDPWPSSSPTPSQSPASPNPASPRSTPSQPADPRSSSAPTDAAAPMDDAQGVTLDLALAVGAGTMRVAPDASIAGTMTLKLAPKGSDGGCDYESTGTTIYTLRGTFNPDTRAYQGSFTSRGDLTTQLKCTTPELGTIPATFDYALQGEGRFSGTMRADGSLEWKSQEEFKASDKRNPKVTTNQLNLSESGTWRRTQ